MANPILGFSFGAGRPVSEVLESRLVEYCRAIDCEAEGGMEMLALSTSPLLVFGSAERAFLLTIEEDAEDSVCVLCRRELTLSPLDVLTSGSIGKEGASDG